MTTVDQIQRAEAKLEEAIKSGEEKTIARAQRELDRAKQGAALIELEGVYSSVHGCGGGALWFVIQEPTVPGNRVCGSFF